MGETGDGGARYWAFISYSHKDAAFGRRLHRRLEGYAVPRRLVGQPASWGTVPRKLAPIFRDRDELSAAHDLTMEVRAALKASRSLIVICSPAAAASQWVAREVEVFRELHPDRPVLAAIRDGEPSGCFPQLLRHAGPDGGLVEPLAADFRHDRDGERLGLLKLVAGVLGISLDALIQRDAHRRMQRVTAITAGALAAMLAMAVLTVFAINARREAERQRGQAEGLVEYMLTDLRDKLKGVGRLDVMTAVNERALHYYAGQDLDTLPVDSLERRARVLDEMGEDDVARRDYEKALTEFREARRTTEALLKENPNDPDRIFDHAQNEFYMGLINYMRGQYDTAQTFFAAYKRMAYRLAAVASHDPRSAQEIGYAEGNLCTNALKMKGQSAQAVSLCSEALKNMERAARGSPKNFVMTKNLANRHSWLASAYLANYDKAHALDELRKEDAFLDQLLHADSRHVEGKYLWASFQRQSAYLEEKMGRKASALDRLTRASSVLDQMIAYDPDNADWRELRRKILEDVQFIQTTKEKHQ